VLRGLARIRFSGVKLFSPVLQLLRPLRLSFSLVIFFGGIRVTFVSSARFEDTFDERMFGVSLTIAVLISHIITETS
jgi:hypothetical protein